MPEDELQAGGRIVPLCVGQAAGMGSLHKRVNEGLLDNVRGESKASGH